MQFIKGVNFRCTNLFLASDPHPVPALPPAAAAGGGGGAPSTASSYCVGHWTLRVSTELQVQQEQMSLNGRWYRFDTIPDKTESPTGQ